MSKQLYPDELCILLNYSPAVTEVIQSQTGKSNMSYARVQLNLVPINVGSFGVSVTHCQLPGFAVIQEIRIPCEVATLT